MICLDQPNRRMRTRMSGGVGGGLRKGAPYPDSIVAFYYNVLYTLQPVPCWPRVNLRYLCLDVAA